MVVRNIPVLNASPVVQATALINASAPSATVTGARCISPVDHMVGSWKLVERHGFDRFLQQRNVSWFKRRQLLRSGLRQNIRRHGLTFTITSAVHGPLRLPQRSTFDLVVDGETKVAHPTLGNTVSWLSRRGESTLVTEADTTGGPIMVRRWVEAGRLFHEITDANNGVMVTQIFDRTGSADQRPMSLRSWTTRLRTE